MIVYTLATTDADLQGILDLQSSNLEATLTVEETRSQGFVTVRHDLALLRQIRGDYHHIVAKAGHRVIGYVLTMLPAARQQIPVLHSLFDRIDQTTYRKKPLCDYSYVVMGQVCIDKAYRGRGVFGHLYAHQRAHLAGDFDLLITEIAGRNTRSLRAHEKVGFIPILEFLDGERWIITLWDWTNGHSGK